MFVLLHVLLDDVLNKEAVDEMVLQSQSSRKPIYPEHNAKQYSLDISDSLKAAML